MTKKAAALLLAASLAVSVCATPVFAADLKHSNGGYGDDKDNFAPNSTNVTYNVDCSYTWSIPTDIKFGSNAGVGATRTVYATQNEDTASVDAKTGVEGIAPKVCVTKNVIAHGKKLNIIANPTSSRTDLATHKFCVQTEDGKVMLYYAVFKYANGSAGTEVTIDNNNVLTVPSGTNTAEQQLMFTLTTADNNATNDAAEEAGEYKGWVSFTASIDD